MNVQSLASRFGSIDSARVLARVTESGPWWAALFLAILMGYLLARLIWLAVPPSEVNWSPPPVTGVVTNTDDRQVDFSAISSARLFGDPSAAPAPAPVAVQEQELLDAPDTRLNLRLRGAISADDPAMAHAIIADGQGNERVYFMDDNIPGGARLHRVQLDRVILSRDGSLEVLRLPRDANGQGRSARATQAPRQAPQPRRERTEPRPATVQELVGDSAAGFLEVVRPQPFMPDGQLRGFRVYPGPNREQFAAVGLRAGDLVTEINGMILNDPSQGLQIFQDIGDATQVNLTVERDGETQNIDVDLSKIDLQGGVTE